MWGLGTWVGGEGVLFGLKTFFVILSASVDFKGL